MHDPFLAVPAGTLTTESSTMLPTTPAYISSPTTTKSISITLYDPISHTVPAIPATSLTATCTGCDNVMPGMLPASSYPTTAIAHATPTQANVFGTELPTATSTSGHGVFREPWVGTATGLLYVYSLLSAFTIILLVFTGRLDLKLNWVHPERRRVDNPLIVDLWRINSMISDRSVRPSQMRYRQTRDSVHMPPSISQAHLRTSGSSQGRRSTDSIAETMIDYGDEPELAAEEAEWYRATEAFEADVGMAIPDGDGTRMASAGQHDGAESEGAAGRHIRHVLGDEGYQEQLRAWQLHELQMMQMRMVRAGYF